MELPSREDHLRSAFGSLQDITRRASARSRQLNEPLTLVEYSLVKFIESTPGTRATDIATAFSLNRSTVSRQVNALVELGLVRHVKHAEDPARGNVLDLTEHGRAQLATATNAQQTTLQERLAGWTDPEVAAFADALARYNDPLH